LGAREFLSRLFSAKIRDPGYFDGVCVIRFNVFSIPGRNLPSNTTLQFWLSGDIIENRMKDGMIGG
jgi:hypothetical protein